MSMNQSQLTDEKFIAKVWQWKYIGIFVWVSISYIVYVLYAKFLCYYFNQQYSSISYLFPFVFLTASAPLYFYSLSLTIVPVRKNVLSLREIKNPSLFFLTQFLWTFLHLSMYISNFRLNMIISGLIIISLLLHLDFTVIMVNIVSDSNNERFINRFSAFKEYCIYSVPLLPLIISFSYFYFTDDLYIGLIVTSTIYISFLFPSICSLIAGEKVSFARIDDGSRLIFGLSNKKSKVVQYWAYNDFLDVSFDIDPSRRSFIFTKSSNIGSIIMEITEMLSKLAESHDSICTDQNNPNKVISAKRNMKFSEKILAPFHAIKSYFGSRWSRSMNMQKERNAASNSIIAIIGIESLVQMILLSEEEDKNGEIQQYTELILNSIINLYRSCDRTKSLIWYTPTFGKDWIVTDYQKLTVKLLKASHNAIVNLIVRFGNRLDMTMIKKENLKIVNSIKKNISDLPDEDLL